MITINPNLTKVAQILAPMSIEDIAQKLKPSAIVDVETGAEIGTEWWTVNDLSPVVAFALFLTETKDGEKTVYVREPSEDEEREAQSRLNLDQKIRLAKAYSGFTMREYGSDFLDGLDDVSDYLSIAFTSNCFGEDEEKDIEVVYDFDRLGYVSKISGSEILFEPCEIEDLIEDLEAGTFDGFVASAIEEGERLYGSEADEEPGEEADELERAILEELKELDNE